MPSKLKMYFPIIWEREELLKEIRSRKELSLMFERWMPEQQEEFLDFCTGVKGIKFLYDAFFKEALNPEYAPERLDELLSLTLNQKVRVLYVLPNDSTRIADESSLLITDIVVELEDGSLANVEVQKIGYKFPGARCACYSADLLLRQYKRIRSEKKKTFSYKDIKNVYTIVLFETSTEEFHKFPDTYLHYFEQTSNTGMKIELLQKYLFIPLDIFKKNNHNKTITSKLDAWLAFLCMDDPDDIIRLIDTYPEFRPMYQEAYQMCRNMEGIMGIFSEELLELDRNTVQLMIDEMQDKLDDLNRRYKEMKQEYGEMQQGYGQMQQVYSEMRREYDEAQQRYSEMQQEKLQYEQKYQEALNRIKELEAAVHQDNSKK